MFAGASATELSASPGILLAILLTAMSFTCGRDNLTGESGSRAVDHGHGHATLYFTRQVVLPVKMSNGPSKDVLFKIAHTARLPNHAAWIFLFFPHLGGPPSRRERRCSRTDVPNIAQTA